MIVSPWSGHVEELWVIGGSNRNIGDGGCWQSGLK